jgi:LysM repeat protein
MLKFVCFFLVRMEHSMPPQLSTEIINNNVSRMVTGRAQGEVQIMRLFALTTAAIIGATFMGASNQVERGATFMGASNQVEQIATLKPKITVKDPAETSRTIMVNPGDYLAKIADANSSTVQRIYDANTEINSPDLIFPGQNIRIPGSKEQLASRPLPSDVTTATSQATAELATKNSVFTTSSAAVVASDSVWDRLAACESGGNWAINTGNGFYGGLQFTLSSWRATGGSGSPSDASRDEQIARGQSLFTSQGWGAWPACSAKLGLS